MSTRSLRSRSKLTVVDTVETDTTSKLGKRNSSECEDDEPSSKKKKTTQKSTIKKGNLSNKKKIILPEKEEEQQIEQLTDTDRKTAKGGAGMVVEFGNAESEESGFDDAEGKIGNSLPKGTETEITESVDKSEIGCDVTDCSQKSDEIVETGDNDVKLDVIYMIEEVGNSEKTNTICENILQKNNMKESVTHEDVKPDEAQNQGSLNIELTGSDNEALKFKDTLSKSNETSSSIHKDGDSVTNSENLVISNEPQNQQIASLKHPISGESKIECEEIAGKDTVQNKNDFQVDEKLILDKIGECEVQGKPQIEDNKTISEMVNSENKETEYNINCANNVIDKGNYEKGPITNKNTNTNNDNKVKKDLVTNLTEELVTSNRSHEQDGFDEKNEGERGESSASLATSGKNMICQKENDPVANKTKELAILTEVQSTKGQLMSDQALIDEEEKKEIKVRKQKLNTKQTKTKDKNETNSETNQIRTVGSEQIIEISDDEENINDGETLTSSRLSETEKYKESTSYTFYLPAMKDPVWKDRLPPPPGCESPPPPPSLPPPTSSLPPTHDSPQSHPSPPIKPQESELSSYYEVNSFLDIEKILKSAKITGSGQFEIEFGINHLPKFTMDYIIKKGVRESQIKTESGAIVVTREMYSPKPPSSTTHQWVKSLHIKGPSEKTLSTRNAGRIHLGGQRMNSPRYKSLYDWVSYCANISSSSRDYTGVALKCLKKLIVIGDETSDIKMEKVFLWDKPPGFSGRERVLGENGANLQYIAEHTGAEVTLRGQNSGYLEANGREHQDMLHIRIRHNTCEGLKLAQEIALNLKKTVAGETEQNTLTPVAHPGLAFPAPIIPPVQTLPPIIPPVQTLPPIIPPVQIPPPIVPPVKIPPPIVPPVQIPPPIIPLVQTSPPIVPPVQIPPSINPSVKTPFSTNPHSTPTSLYQTSPSEPKLVFEAGPQLKNQTTNNNPNPTTSTPGFATTSSQSTYSSQAAPNTYLGAPVHQFAVPLAPVKRPSKPLSVPPPLKKPPSATPSVRSSSLSQSPLMRNALTFRPAPQPSPLVSASPEMRNALTFQPQSKTETKTEVKRSSESVSTPKQAKKTDQKPKKIKFSIITGTKPKAKLLSNNPLAAKKTPPSEDENENESETENEKEKSESLNQVTDATTGNTLQIQRENKKTSRWGQKTESVPQLSRAYQLMKSLNEQIDKLPCDGNKFKLIKMFNLLESAIPQTKDVTDKQRSQLTLIVEILKKTLKYLPSNQLSKTLWEMVSVLKADYIEDDLKSQPENPQESNSKTDSLKNKVRDHKEEDARENTSRRERERPKTSSSSSSSSSSRKHETHPYNSYSQESRKRSYRNPSSTSSYSQKTEPLTERSRQRDSPKSSSSKEKSYHKESDARKSGFSSEGSRRRDLPNTYSSKEKEFHKENDTQTLKPSKIEHKREESPKSSAYKQEESGRTFPDCEDNDGKNTGNLTFGQIPGRSSSASVDNINRKLTETMTDVSSNECIKSEICDVEQTNKAVKTENPFPSKSSNSELQTVMKLLYKTLKEATNYIENNSVKLELSKIAQLLEHTLPTENEVSNEQRSQFSIVLDVLEQALQRNKGSLGQTSDHLTSIIKLLKSILKPNLTSIGTNETVGTNTSLGLNTAVQSSSTTVLAGSENTVNLGTVPSVVKQLPEINVKTESGTQKPDDLILVIQLLHKAIKAYADSLDDGVMSTRLTLISKSLEVAASKSNEITEREQSNLLKIIKLLEKLLSANQPSSSQQPTVLEIIQQLKRTLESNTFTDKSSTQQGTSKLIDQANIQKANIEVQKSPEDNQQSKLLEMIKILQICLYEFSTSMEPGYLKSQITQISQLLKTELKENMNTLPLEQLKKQISPLVTLLNQLLQNQPSSNDESQRLVNILRLIEMSLNTPVNPVTPHLTNPLDSLQQLQMFQALQSMQAGLPFGMRLPFSSAPFQAMPVANNLLQLQMMQMMQQMQAVLGSQSQTENPMSGQLNQLSQQLQALQQQFVHVSQLSQQQSFQSATGSQQFQPTDSTQQLFQSVTGSQRFQPTNTSQQLFQSTGIPQQQPLSVAGSQSFIQPATSQASLSDLMLQLQQGSQQPKENK